MFAPSLRQSEEGRETLKELHAKLSSLSNQLCALRYREGEGSRELAMKVAPLKDKLDQAESRLKDFAPGAVLPLDWKMREAEELLDKVDEGIHLIDAHEEDPNCNQKAYYMANVLLVVHADKEVDSAESDLIADIAEGIGATENELSHARQLVSEGHYYLHQVGSFSDQIRNLEDMIRACFSDGEVHPSEKELIENFAGSLGVDQERMDLIEEWLGERIN